MVVQIYLLKLKKKKKKKKKIILIYKNLNFSLFQLYDQTLQNISFYIKLIKNIIIIIK